MPLTPCVACQQPISDLAKACPRCGHPVAPVTSAQTPITTKVIAKEGLFLRTLNVGCAISFVIVGLVVAIGLLGIFHGAKGPDTDTLSKQAYRNRKHSALSATRILPSDWRLSANGTLLFDARIENGSLINIRNIHIRCGSFTNTITERIPTATHITVTNFPLGQAASKPGNLRCEVLDLDLDLD